MKKVLSILFVLLFHFSMGQRAHFLIATLAPSPADINGNSANTGCIFNRYYYAGSNTSVHAYGVIFSTNPSLDSLSFYNSYYVTTPPNVIFKLGGSGYLSRQFNCTIGSNPSYPLIPNTRYYVRGFVFTTESGVKYKFYGNVVSFITHGPILNNFIISGNKTICTNNNNVPEIQATLPDGGNRNTNYSYSWQKKSDIDSNWVTIENSNTQNYTPQIPNRNGTINIWYRRMVKSGEYVDSTNCDPVLYTYINPGNIPTLTLEKIPGFDEIIEVKINPLSDGYFTQFQDSIPGRNWQNLSDTSGASILNISLDTIVRYYRATVSYLNCAQYNSPVYIAGKIPGVRIGNQIWMAENLSPKYHRPIQQIQDSSTWYNATTAGYCWYNNDSITYDNKHYGALYNYFAATANVCPSGWRVPTRDDWDILMRFSGGESRGGGNLKQISTLNWNAPNTGATNSLNFTALPGGFRQAENSKFTNVGQTAKFWTQSISSQVTQGHAGSLFTEDTRVGTPRTYKTEGCSIRCIKN